MLLSKKVVIKSLVESDDPWVQDYMVMVSNIELGTEVDEMPQECELSNLSSCYKELSTLTLKGGNILILKDNSEIIVTKSERENILQIALPFFFNFVSIWSSVSFFRGVGVIGNDVLSICLSTLLSPFFFRKLHHYSKETSLCAS